MSEMSLISSFEKDCLCEKLIKMYSEQVRKISSVGGSTLRDGVKRAMQALLTHEVELHFNWTGMKGYKGDQTERRSFRQLKLSHVVKGVYTIQRRRNVTKCGGGGTSLNSGSESGGHKHIFAPPPTLKSGGGNLPPPPRFLRQCNYIIFIEQ